MKIIFLIVAMFLFVPLKGQEWTRPQINQGKRLVGQAMNKAVTRISKKYGLRAVGSGLSMPGGPIRIINLDFTKNGRVTKEQARRLFVACIDEIMQAVYETPRLNNYLYDSSFKFENIGLVIFVHGEREEDLVDPEIGVIGQGNGTIEYITNNQTGFGYKQTISETYEEALAAIKREDEQYQICLGRAQEDFKPIELK